MANQSPTPAGAQPQEGNQAPVGTSGHTPGNDTNDTQFDAASAIDSMDDLGAMESILFGDGKPSASAKPEPAPQTAKPNHEEPAQGSQQEPESTQAESEQRGPDDDDHAAAPASREPNEQGPDRISLRTLPPAERKLVTEAVNLFRSGKAATLADALNQLGLTAGSTPQEQPPAQDAPQQQQAPPETARQTDVPQPDPEVARITAVVADLREQRKRAIAEYDRETEASLTDQIEDAIAELSEARASARIEKQTQDRQQQLIQSAIEEVNLQFPEAEDPTSFFSYRMSQAIDAYEAVRGPVSANPAALMELARQVNAAIASTPGTPGPAHQAPKPETNARPLGTAASARNAPLPLTGEALQRTIEEASEEVLWGALSGV